jgi:hypothetical protein
MMDATRTRLSFTGDWIAAAALLLGTLLVGILVVRELRVAPRAFVANDPATTAAAAVPAEAVSVPTLTLGPATQIAVGDRLSDIDARLDGTVTAVSKSRERGAPRPREIRNYVLAGTKFTIVAEPFERNGALRIASIYLQ